MTYRHKMAIHVLDVHCVIAQPSFWVKLQRVLAKDTRIAMDNNRVNTHYRPFV